MGAAYSLSQATYGKIQRQIDEIKQHARQHKDHQLWEMADKLYFLVERLSMDMALERAK